MTTYRDLQEPLLYDSFEDSKELNPKNNQPKQETMDEGTSKAESSLEQIRAFEQNHAIRIQDPSGEQIFTTAMRDDELLSANFGASQAGHWSFEPGDEFVQLNNASRPTSSSAPLNYSMGQIVPASIVPGKRSLRYFPFWERVLLTESLIVWCIAHISEHTVGRADCQFFIMEQSAWARIARSNTMIESIIIRKKIIVVKLGEISASKRLQM